MARRDCDYVLVGPGAGGGPTAVAVLGDVCELARGARKFSGAPSLIAPGTLKLQREDEIDVPFYVRFVVKDRAGIVGDIGKTFGRIGVNISEIWQLRHVEEELHSLMQSYRLKQKQGEILPFVMTLGAHDVCGRCAGRWILSAIVTISWSSRCGFRSGVPTRHRGY